jgi:hypothetical protein
MKIGLITGEYPPMQGGVGAFTQELARALAALPDAPELHILTHREARPTGDPARRNWRELRQPVDLGFAQLYPHVRRWRWPIVSETADWIIRYELDVVNIQYQAAAYHMRSPAANFLPWRLRPLAPTSSPSTTCASPTSSPKRAACAAGWSISWPGRPAASSSPTSPTRTICAGRGCLRPKSPRFPLAAISPFIPRRRRPLPRSGRNGAYPTTISCLAISAF